MAKAMGLKPKLGKIRPQQTVREFKKKICTFTALDQSV
jgi:hypothetical protein